MTELAGDPEAPLHWTGKSLRNGVSDRGRGRRLGLGGIDNHTAQFAVASIRGRWEQLGSRRYPKARTLTITADCSGSNGNRTRLFGTPSATPSP